MRSRWRPSGRCVNPSVGSSPRVQSDLRSWGRLRLFRYEVRCWRAGTIPDLAAAVDSPRRVSTDAARARRVLELVPAFPVATWGRDEQHTGEMWNSNSLTAWLLARSGHDTDSLPFQPPVGGRAPGWSAGLIVATRAEAGSVDDGRRKQPWTASPPRTEP